MDNQKPATIAEVSPVTVEAPVSLGEPPVQDAVAPEDQLYKATFLRRFGALLLDTVVVILLYIPLFVIGTVTKQTWIILLNYLVIYSYFIFFTWKYGATLGKKWVNIRVVSADEKPLNFIQVFLREVIGKIASALIFDLGYMWALWDKDRQTWHDKIANTYVVTPIPNNSKTSGCTIALVIGLLVFVPVVIIIVAIIAVIAINPLELQKQVRDGVRISDLASVADKINTVQKEASGSAVKLCGTQTVPCIGKSVETGAANIDGTGWVKVDLSSQSLTLPKLPIDLVNSGQDFYQYCSDGKDWEIDARVEANKSQDKALSDNGDDPNLYELGTNLKLCPQSNSSANSSD